MTTPGGGPLEGITVLDLSNVGPAARATRLLADYGASVVKIAAPPGRGPAGAAHGRGPAAPPQAQGPGVPSPAFHAYGARRGMRRALVDLREPEGRDAFLALAARSDVVVESFRPGTAERLGIGYDAVSRRNPKVVYCSTTGYGRDGPRARWAGHDLNYLATGGYLAMSEPTADGGPPLPGATVADAAAGGMHAALAITTALFRRASSGQGAHLDVSVTDGVLWLMSLQLDEHLATGSEPAPGHDVLSGRYACYGTYRARDDRWLAVGAIEPKFFANLCTALGCERWIERQYDDDAQEALRGDLAAVFATADRDEWVARLAAADTCVSPVQTVAEVAVAEQSASSGAVVDAKSDVHGSFRQLGPVLAGTAPLPNPVHVPDEQATDTVALLVAAGYEESLVDELRARGVVA